MHILLVQIDFIYEVTDNENRDSANSKISLNSEFEVLDFQGENVQIIKKKQDSKSELVN